MTYRVKNDVCLSRTDLDRFQDGDEYECQTTQVRFYERKTRVYA